MSLTLTAQHNHDDDENYKADITEEGYSKENLLDNRKMGTNTNIMPQDLRQRDKLLMLNKKTTESNFKKSVSEISPKSSPPRRHVDGCLDEDVYTITAADGTTPSSSLQITTIDGFFNRKRGRPPKNRFVEVYKNTHQIPQAIFTSFKLEKQSMADGGTNYHDSINHGLQSRVESSRGCDSDNKQSIDYHRHKPTNENSTHRQRFSRANTILSTHSGNNCSSFNDFQLQACDENSPNPMADLTNGVTDYCLSDKSSDLNLSRKSLDDRSKPKQRNLSEHKAQNDISPVSGSALKKLKLSGTTEKVTVIRAAGTFYPENSIDTSKACKNFEARSASMKDEQSILSCGTEVAENLSLKDTMQMNATDCLESPTSGLTTTADCSSVLPQIYNVLQIQQQLFAFYQQMALMTPTLTLLAPTLGPTNALNEFSSPASSTATSAGSEVALLNNTRISNVILNLKKNQANQNSIGEMTSSTRAEDRVNQMHKKTATTIKVNNRSGNITTPYAASTKTLFTAGPKIPDRHFQCGRDRTPSGYLRFRFNEDCGYEQCGYRQHQSHFHCNRTDCQYSFCDKTRFVQHTARHERLDTLMGSDFEQYRGKVTCHYTNCPYAFNAAEDLNDSINAKKVSHFHCLKCPFVCADTNKVVAHRRLHSKMEFIRLAGFRKVTSNENCMIANIVSDPNKQLEAACNQLPIGNISHCPYAMRHAHYHCLVCNCSVLTRSQLLAHKHRNLALSNSSVPPQQPLEAPKFSLENQLHKDAESSTLKSGLKILETTPYT